MRKSGFAAAVLAAAVTVSFLHTAPALAAKPQPTQPTELKACGVIDQPGAYVLVNNLAAAGDCLLVTADDVDIDLAGFVISGDGTGIGIGSDANDGFLRRNISVRNGTVTGFLDGLRLDYQLGGIVEGVRAVGNGGVGLALDGSAGAIVRGNIAEGNGGHGIEFGGGAIIAGNTATGNGGNGLNARGFGSRIDGNTVSGNAGLGIAAAGGNATSGNTIIAGNAVGLFAGSNSTVRDNTVRSAGTAIQVECPSNVIGNTAVSSLSTPLDVIGTTCNLVDNLAP